MKKTLSIIERRAKDGLPIYVLKGETSGDPDVWGADVPAGTVEWQFSDGPGTQGNPRGCSEDHLDLHAGIAQYASVNPSAIFVFDPADHSGGNVAGSTRKGEIVGWQIWLGDDFCFNDRPSFEVLTRAVAERELFDACQRIDSADIELIPIYAGDVEEMTLIDA